MQLSARILTALAVLAFTVAIVAGARSATDEVSAATGTIDALNVGVCTTTNADVFGLSDCGQLNADDEREQKAFFQQGELDDLIEVETLFATYAHDPSTAAEAPRAILTDGDSVLISITDPGRDRRDPVLVTTVGETPDDDDGIEEVAGTPPTIMFRVGEDDTTTEDIDESMIPKTTVADTVGVKPGELPTIEQQVEFNGADDLGGTAGSTYINSGTYEIIWERETDEEDDFKPIAPDGVVKFFGRVDDGIAGVEDGDKNDGFGPFKNIGSNIALDEDVISGEPNEPPVMTLNISVPDGASGSPGHGSNPGHLLRDQRD